MIRNFALIAAGAVLLSGCVLNPYESAFQACDDEAGVCYRFCEDAPTEASGQACRQGCDDAANQCFDDAYTAYDYAGSNYAYGGPWYGSYGYWRPGYGYFYSFDYYTRGHRHRDPYYDHWRRHRHGHGGRGYRHGGRGGRDQGGGGRGGRGDGAPPPATTPPPTEVAPPPPPRPRPERRPSDVDERDIRQVPRG